MAAPEGGAEVGVVAGFLTPRQPRPRVMHEHRDGESFLACYGDATLEHHQAEEAVRRTLHAFGCNWV